MLPGGPDECLPGLCAKVAEDAQGASRNIWEAAQQEESELSGLHAEVRIVTLVFSGSAFPWNNTGWNFPHARGSPLGGEEGAS